MLTIAHKFRSYSTTQTMDEIIAKFKIISSNYIHRGRENFFKVVNLLAQLSYRTKGASFAKVSTMADMLGLSERTIQRIINKLIHFGLIKKFHYYDETGAQRSNIYQIKPLEEIDWVDIQNRMKPAEDKSRIVSADNGEVVNLDDVGCVEGDDTPPTPSQPLVRKDWSKDLSIRSFVLSKKNYKKINEYKEITTPFEPFPFFNWLES